jgi:hypothetical protein
MKLWHLAAMTAMAGAGPAFAQSAAPAVIDALDSYNAMGVAVPPLSLARPREFEGSAMLPAWLADIPLTHQEASAVIAAVSTYRMDPDMRGEIPVLATSEPQSHHSLLHNVLSGAAQIAGTSAVEGAAVANHRNDPNYVIPPGFGDNSTPSPATKVTYAAPAFRSRADRYAYVLQAMGSCPGALRSALHKMAEGHGDTMFVSELQGLYTENAAMHAAPSADCSYRK